MAGRGREDRSRSAQESTDRRLGTDDWLHGCGSRRRDVLAVAMMDLLVNLASMKLLAGGSSESLNVKRAYFEVLSDMLGSLGVIIAAPVVMLTGWTLADPIVGAGIG